MKVSLFLASGLAVACVSFGWPAFGQTAAKTETSYNPPKTAWGDPDLQGVYTTDDLNGVPLERPAKYGTRRFLTEQEFADRAKEVNSEKSTIDTGIRPTTGFWSRVKDAGVDAAAGSATGSSGSGMDSAAHSAA